MVSNWTVS